MKHIYQAPEVRLTTCQVENGYALSHADPTNPTPAPQLEEFHETNYSYGNEIF